MARFLPSFSFKGKTIREFRNRGWRITNVSIGSVSYFMWRDDVGRVAVCLTQVAPSVLRIQDAGLISHDQDATIAIFSKEKPSQEAVDVARDRRVILLGWDQLGELDRKLHMLENEYRHLVAEAKTSERAKLPPLKSDVPLRALLPEESQADFACATDHVSCYFDNREHATLVIAFAQWAAHPGSKWGAAFAEEAQWSVLGFETPEPNWFPEEDVVACAATMRPHLEQEFVSRVTLGVSQGGFGALRHGQKLGAELAIAISPVFSIDPGVVPGNRFSPYYKAPLHSGMHLTRTAMPARIVIIYDPYEPQDRTQADRILALGDIQALPVPFAGHSCYHLFTDVETFVRVIEFCRAGQIADAKVLLAQLRSKNPQRAYYMALHCSERRPLTGLALFRAHANSARAGDWIHVCYRLSEAGLAADVVDWAHEAADAHLDDAELQATAALIALKAARPEAAAGYIERALAKQPANPKFIHIEKRVSEAWQRTQV